MATGKISAMAMFVTMAKNAAKIKRGIFQNGKFFDVFKILSRTKNDLNIQLFIIASMDASGLVNIE